MAHRSAEDTEPDNRIDDVTTYLGERYELVLLPVLMAFMFFTRYQSRSNFLSDDSVLLSAVDSYYHWRTTLYTVENWPNTMPYDVWTAFPDGRYVGQFGTWFNEMTKPNMFGSDTLGGSR